MKKIALFAVVAFIGASSLTSCASKKDYTCTCSLNGDEVVSLEIKDSKKSDAESMCKDQTATVPGVTYSCVLK